MPCVLHAETLHTSDGRRITGTLMAVDRAQATINVDGAARTIPLAEVTSIDFEGRAAADVMSLAGQAVAVAEDGSLLAVRDLAVVNGKVTGTAAGVRISVPLEAFARLLLPRGHEKPADVDRHRAALKIQRGAQDVLVMAAGDGPPVPVNGILEGISEGKIRFTYDANAASYDLARVLLVELAKTSDKAPAAPAGRLMCVDGSQLCFAAIECTSREARVSCASLGRLAVPLAQVAGVRFRDAQKAVYLSDLRPVEVRHTPMFDEPFRPRVDQSAVGQPLRLGGQSYAKGLGLHARAELTYELGGEYRQLAGVLGIDDTLRFGTAVVRFTLDGKPLGETVKLDRSQPPERLRLDISGGKRLMIAVDFAENFGAGARVNLCEPTLTK